VKNLATDERQVYVFMEKRARRWGRATAEAWLATPITATSLCGGARVVLARRHGRPDPVRWHADCDPSDAIVGRAHRAATHPSTRDPRDHRQSYPMPRPLPEQVIVITGASSGIGRETARQLARHGASLVLVARNEAALRETAAEVEALGGRALVAPADVSDREQVQRVADQAARHFGRIDTWVNGAAVSTYGTVEQTTIDEIRRIIDVDLLGTIYGMKAALPYLRRTRGALINISSVTGERAVPLLATYSAAKHGIVGFSEALRMELDHDRAGISVTTILPYGINTPFFNHARSKLGVLPRPTPPAYEPAAVAEAIVWAAEHPTREIVVGGAAKGVLLLQRLSPALLDRLMTIGGLAFKMQQSTRPDDGVDNLFAPAPGDYAVRGAFDRITIPGNGYTRTFEFHPARQRLVVMGMLLAIATVVRRAGRG
jgi:short-subunit dehydrogenase